MMILDAKCACKHEYSLLVTSPLEYHRKRPKVAGLSQSTINDTADSHAFYFTPSSSA